MNIPLVIGNWKMHGSLSSNQQRLVSLLEQLPAIGGVNVAICPPHPYLIPVRAQLTGSVVQLGAQNLNPHPQGAHTGEVNADMLLDLGVRYVLVGHSERRTLYAESDTVVAAKFEAALQAGLVPVLCVGETLAEREADLTQTVVSRQIDAVLERVGVQGFNQAVIAYEPVWAIGTGKTASTAQAQQIHALIRQKLAALDPEIAARLPILYGGSVKAENAAELFRQPDINGGLVGGASLDAKAFALICQAAS